MEQTGGLAVVMTPARSGPSEAPMNDQLNDKLARMIEIDDRIAKLRNDILDLTNRAASVSGQAAEDSIAGLIENSETQLTALLAMREALGETAAD